MSVQSELLASLRCIECKNYLSCGPVYITQDGGGICGRCNKPRKQHAIQNKQYEAMAADFCFPCKNAEFGCQKILKFSQQNEDTHEEYCDFRKLSCPMLIGAKCDWTGTWMDLMKHSVDDHPTFVINNPGSIQHEISKSNLNNYFIATYEYLFILHTKICCTSKKIFHEIRVLGDSRRAENFEYELVIRRKKNNLTKSIKVAPEGSLSFEDNTPCISLSFNNLEESLDGLDDIRFDIALKQKEGNTFNIITPKDFYCEESVACLSSHIYGLRNRNKCETCGYFLKCKKCNCYGFIKIAFDGRLCGRCSGPFQCMKCIKPENSPLLSKPNKETTLFTPGNSAANKELKNSSPIPEPNKETTLYTPGNSKVNMELENSSPIPEPNKEATLSTSGNSKVNMELENSSPISEPNKETTLSTSGNSGANMELENSPPILKPNKETTPSTPCNSKANAEPTTSHCSKNIDHYVNCTCQCSQQKQDDHSNNDDVVDNAGAVTENVEDAAANTEVNIGAVTENVADAVADVRVNSKQSKHKKTHAIKKGK